MSCFLVALMVNATLVREMHHLLHHDHHHAQGLECDAEGNEYHFHQTPEQEGDCLLCAYQFSPSQEVESPSIDVPVPIIAQKSAFSYQKIITVSSVCTQYLRGPPHSFFYS